MVKLFKILISFFVVLILIIIGVYYIVLPDLCGNTIISSTKSPNKKWKVVFFERNCGATTGFSYQVSLIESEEELPNASGNIYIDHGNSNNKILIWKSNNTVIIKNTLKNSFKVTNLNGINIIYE